MFVNVYLATEDKRVFFLKEIDQRAHQEIYHQEYSEVLWYFGNACILRSKPLMITIMISKKKYAFQLAFARFFLNFNTGCWQVGVFIRFAIWRNPS